MEMPDTTGMYSANHMVEPNKPRENRLKYNELLYSSESLSPAEPFGQLTVKKEESHSKLHYYFFDEDVAQYVAFCFLKKTSDNGVYTDSLWKYQPYKKETMQDILINYVLPQFKYIESHYEHTTLAENMWKNMLLNCFNKSYTISFIKDKNENRINTMNELTQWIDDAWHNVNIIPRIYAK